MGVTVEMGCSVLPGYIPTNVAIYEELVSDDDDVCSMPIIRRQTPVDVNRTESNDV